MFNEQANEMIEDVIVLMEKYLEDKRLPNMTAKYMMGLFRALQREGFTDEQAMDIITKQPIPSLKS